MVQATFVFISVPWPGNVVVLYCTYKLVNSIIKNGPYYNYVGSCAVQFSVHAN